MTDEMMAAAETKLKTLDPAAAVYRHDRPKESRTPCFVISVTGQSCGRLLAGAFAGKLSLDIQYVSDAADSGAVRADCVAVQETLLREFQLLGRFRCIGKNAQITDNILHFTFDVKYSERAAVTGPQMNSVTNSAKEK